MADGGDDGRRYYRRNATQTGNFIVRFLPPVLGRV